jgi:hypothetical protein
MKAYLQEMRETQEVCKKHGAPRLGGAGVDDAVRVPLKSTETRKSKDKKLRKNLLVINNKSDAEKQ